MDRQFCVRELARPLFQHKQVLFGSWSVENSYGGAIRGELCASTEGGAIEIPAKFLDNPNFLLRFERPVKLRLHLYTAEDISI